MKPAKIMLMSIAILGIVGGALGFKVNKKYNHSYCILATIPVPLPGRDTCTAELINAKFAGVNPLFTFYYTTKQIGIPCTKKRCTVSTGFEND